MLSIEEAFRFFLYKQQVQHFALHKLDNFEYQKTLRRCEDWAAGRIEEGGAVCSLWSIGCHMFPYSDWATTPILENIPDSLGDIERVKTQKNIVRNGTMTWFNA